jgi:hypothetical protein
MPRTLDDPVEDAIGWMLDTFGPWSPAVLMILVAGLLITMSFVLGPPRKTEADVTAEVEKLRELGFDADGNPLPDGPLAHVAQQKQQRQQQFEEDDFGEEEYDFLGDESESDEEGTQQQASTLRRRGDE